MTAYITVALVAAVVCGLLYFFTRRAFLSASIGTFGPSILALALERASRGVDAFDLLALAMLVVSCLVVNFCVLLVMSFADI